MSDLSVQREVTHVQGEVRDKDDREQGGWMKKVCVSGCMGG